MRIVVRLDRLLVERRLTLTELAERARLYPGRLAGYEAGLTRPTLATLDRLLTALDADLGDLVVQLERVQTREQENPQRPVRGDPAGYLLVPLATSGGDAPQVQHLRRLARDVLCYLDEEYGQSEGRSGAEASKRPAKASREGRG